MKNKDFGKKWKRLLLVGTGKPVPQKEGMDNLVIAERIVNHTGMKLMKGTEESML